MQGDKQSIDNATHTPSPKAGCCLNCHFLMKWDRLDNGSDVKFTLARDERSRLGSGEGAEHVLGANYSLACFHTVWDLANRRKDSEHDLVRVLTDDRGETCFFYPYTPGMSFPAGAELERRETERREANRDRKLTKVEIVVGVLAALACTAIGAILTKLHG